MREEWVVDTLSDIAEVVMGQSPPGSSYNSTGSGMPFIQGSAEFGTTNPNPVKWCTDPRKIAEPGDVLFSVRAPVGDLNVANQRIAIGRGLSIIRGTNGKATTPYLALALSFGAREIAKRSSTGMFTSITGAQLKSLPIALPPLHEQKRIVDLMDSVDAAISAAQAEAEAALELLRNVRNAVPLSQREVAMGTLVTMRSGPSWKSADESLTPGAGREPVIGITNTPASREMDLSSIKYVRGIPKTAQRLTDSSLVMIRTNGNRARIGNIYRSVPEASGFAVSAFQIAIAPVSENDGEFLYWFLGSNKIQSEITECASGSTGLGNIAIGWLKKLAVPILDSNERAEYIERCQSAYAAHAAAQSALDRLRDLRSSMLTVLLSGEHEIPESYDQFLTESVETQVV